MKTKVDRAREITRAILLKKQILRSYTNGINVPQRVELRLGLNKSPCFSVTQEGAGKILFWAPHPA